MLSKSFTVQHGPTKHRTTPHSTARHRTPVVVFKIYSHHLVFILRIVQEDDTNKVVPKTRQEGKMNENLDVTGFLVPRLNQA